MREHATRRVVLAGGLTLAGSMALAATPLGSGDGGVHPPPDFTGVNLAGAEFGPLLGVHGREYLYPPEGNVDYYARLGFNLIRLPFKWERLEPELGKPFALPEFALLKDCVAGATRKGLHVVIDPHNYAKRRVAADGWTEDHVIGSPTVPVAAFLSFWSRLAAAFSNDDRVIFGLMNEPTDIEGAAWLEAAGGAVAAIREGGARNLILVPGADWTGAHSWMSSGNTRMSAIADPASNVAFEVHQYFDRDSSGTSPQAVSATIGSERIRAFQDWARKNRVRGFLGEFNGGGNETGYDALGDICREMAANRDVWLGWAAWAGGPRWPEDDIFNLEPVNGVIREQTRILASFARRN